MKFYVSTWVAVGLVAEFTTHRTLGIYSYRNTEESLNASTWVLYPNEILYNAEKITSMLARIESGFDSSKKTTQFFIINRFRESDRIASMYGEYRYLYLPLPKTNIYL